MIVVPEDGRLRIVTQSDHAHLAGEIARLWRTDGLPENPRRDDVLFAAREHDNGWRETDSAPWVDAETGRPYDFVGLPDGPKIELWRRGIERYAERRPYATLLICRHAASVYGYRRGEPTWDDDLFGPLEELVGELLETTGARPEEVDADYRFIALTDRISLAACGGWTEPFDVAGHRGHRSGDTIHLAPFPLAGSTTFQVRCRSISDRAYDGPVDLIGELASARWIQVPVRLAPAEPARGLAPAGPS